MTLNLAAIVQNSAREHPTKNALIIGATSITYAQLAGMMRKVASILDALEVTAGANVALMLPNVPQFSAAYFGTLFRGNCVVPLNVLFKRDEVKYHLEDSDAEVLFVWEGFLKEAEAGFVNAKCCKHLVVVPQDPKSTQEYEGPLCNFNALLREAKLKEDMAVTSPADTAVILYTSGTTGKPKGAELSHFNLFQVRTQQC